ncbi:DUF882 domain-containing protein [Caenispirillum bisanense]|uniref:Murein endopeptidase K n=1 Tax=Caenispirillum bisanense TaxID=414052 RepID=A0A286GND9_9PROT|nr:DUF882 domain-containing protein [Caenispirillum bisanense]SOD96676.1 Uncharacterized conserved protein YcbK, DUF882 family [Caenispirillum bisanense]
MLRPRTAAPQGGPAPSRRAVLTGLLGAAAAATVFSATGPASAAVPRIPSAPGRLRFHNLHTGDTVDVTYREKGRYLPDALEELNTVLRDHRTGDVHDMDPSLFDILVDLARAVDNPKGRFNIISGYRSPRTNAMLASASGGVAKKSLHMQGMAIDIALDGTSLKYVRKAGIALQRGGVGYYPKSGFVHLDTGRVRSW